jgi:hypothetical protein
MSKRYCIKLFITAATKPSAEAQLERVLKELPREEYIAYVHDVNVPPNDEVAALDNVTMTPCLVLDDFNGEYAQRSLVGVLEDDQVRRFLLGVEV